jgi:hypothetical protein
LFVYFVSFAVGITSELLFLIGNDFLNSVVETNTIHRLFLHLFVTKMFPEAEHTIDCVMIWQDNGFGSTLTENLSRVLRTVAADIRADKEYFTNRYTDIFWLLSALPLLFGTNFSSNGDREMEAIGSQTLSTIQLEAASVVGAARRQVGTNSLLVDKLVDTLEVFKNLLDFKPS